MLQKGVAHHSRLSDRNYTIGNRKDSLCLQLHGQVSRQPKRCHSAMLDPKGRTFRCVSGSLYKNITKTTTRWSYFFAKYNGLRFLGLVVIFRALKKQQESAVYCYFSMEASSHQKSQSVLQKLMFHFLVINCMSTFSILFHACQANGLFDICCSSMFSPSSLLGSSQHQAGHLPHIKAGDFDTSPTHRKDATRQSNHLYRQIRSKNAKIVLLRLIQKYF